jgi:hypothetical protein
MLTISIAVATLRLIQTQWLQPDNQHFGKVGVDAINYQCYEQFLD